MAQGICRKEDIKLRIRACWRDHTGTFHLRGQSLAINGASKKYPAVKTDMDGQQRTFQPDIGADEFSKEPVKAHILNSSEVGASATIPK